MTRTASWQRATANYRPWGRPLWIALAVAGLCLHPANASEKPAPAAARLIYPNGVALNAQGELFFSDLGAHQIFKLGPRGDLTVVAGTGAGGYTGDGGPALAAKLFAPHDLAFDAGDNLLVADTYNHRIRRIDRQGVITTIAGNGKGDYSTENGLATEVSLNNPQGLALDREGNLYIADTFNYRVLRLGRDGRITTFAGSEPGLAGDGGPATLAQLSLPMAVAVAPDGSVLISDAGNSRIRRVNHEGIIQTIAGRGEGSGVAGSGFGGDGGPPEKARIFSAAGLAFDAVGQLFISDSGNNRIRVIRDGIISTWAGTGGASYGGDGGSAKEAAFNTPQKIAVARDGRVFVADRANHRVRMIDAEGRIQTVAGTGRPAGIMVESTVLQD